MVVMKNHDYIFSDDDDGAVVLSEGQSFVADNDNVPDSAGEDTDVADATPYEHPEMPTDIHFPSKAGFLGKGILESSGDSIMMSLDATQSPVVIGILQENGDTTRSCSATVLDPSPRSRLSFSSDKLKKVLGDRSSSKESTNDAKGKSDFSRVTERSTIPPDIISKTETLFPSTQAYVADILAEAGQKKYRAKPAKRKPVGGLGDSHTQQADALQKLSRSGSRIIPQDPSLPPVAKQQKTPVQPSSSDELALNRKTAALSARKRPTGVKAAIEVTSSPATRPIAVRRPETASSDRILRDILRARAQESDEDDDYDVSGRGVANDRWNKAAKKTKADATVVKASAKSTARGRNAKPRPSAQLADKEASVPSSKRPSRTVDVANAGSNPRDQPERIVDGNPAELAFASESSSIEVSNGPGARLLKNNKTPTDQPRKKAKIDGHKAKFTKLAECVDSDDDDKDAVIDVRKDNDLEEVEGVRENMASPKQAKTANRDADRDGSVSNSIGNLAKTNGLQSRAAKRAGRSTVLTSSDVEQQHEAKRRASKNTDSDRQQTSQDAASTPTTARDSRKRKAPEVVIEIDGKRTSALSSPASKAMHYDDASGPGPSRPLAETEQFSTVRIAQCKKVSEAQSATKHSIKRIMTQAGDDESALEAEEAGHGALEPEVQQLEKGKPKAKQSEAAKNKQKKKQTPVEPATPQNIPARAESIAIMVPIRSPVKVSEALQAPSKPAGPERKGLLAVVGKYGGGLGVKTQGISRKDKVPSLLKFMGPMPAKRPPIPIEKKKLKKGEEIYSDEDQEEKNDQPEEWWDGEDYHAWNIRMRKRAKAKGLLEDYISGPSASRNSERSLDVASSDT